MTGIPGAEITVDQGQNGPPTDPPVNIEVASDNFDDLIKTAVALKNYLDSIQTPGVEEFKMDIDLTNPEITLTVDRQRAMIEGINFLADRPGAPHRPVWTRILQDQGRKGRI